MKTLFLLAALAQQPDTARPAFVTDGALFLRSSARTFTAPLRWDRRDLIGVGFAAGAIAGTSLLDGSLRDFLNDHQSVANSDRAARIENLGTITNYRALTALYVAGLVLDDEKLRRTATEAVVSSIVAGALITPVLQTGLGRKRPRANEAPYTFEPLGGGHSFPSGHATQAFAVASVIALEYPKTWVKIAAYGTAAAVGVSRMYNGAHFFSDVVAAGILGHAVARAGTLSK